MIRTAIAADLPALQGIYAASSLSNAGDAPLLRAQPEYLIFAGDGIAESRTRVAVEDDGTLVGFVTTVRGADGELELEDLFVDPARHRQGVARRLVADVAETARAAGESALWVTGNPHALAFYHAVGFVEIDTIATALGTGLRLRLPL